MFLIHGIGHFFGLSNWGKINETTREYNSIIANEWDIRFKNIGYILIHKGIFKNAGSYLHTSQYFYKGPIPGFPKKPALLSNR